MANTVVGIPAEIKAAEGRVAITPDGVAALRSRGVEVLVEAGAGLGSSLPDADFAAAGARIVPQAADVWGAANLIVKVKEPLESEWRYLRDDLTLFTYLHLAGYPKLADALVAAKTTAVAYETVTVETVGGGRSLPLLAPMSEIAGRMATQIGAHFLEYHQRGKGVLLGGVPGVRPGKVCVVGAGNVGWNAAVIAAGMQAEVKLFDNNLERLRWVDQYGNGRITTLASNPSALERALVDADLLIGAVLVPGRKAPVVISEDMIRMMEPRSVVIDVAVDQGGCVETSRETSHAEPVHEAHGVMHYGVANIPGAVPHTSTWALTNATLPYLVALAVDGLAGAVRRYPELEAGINTAGGEIVNADVREALGVG